MNGNHTPRDAAPDTSDPAGSTSDEERSDDFRSALAGLTYVSMYHDLPAMLTHIAEFAVQAIPRADGAGLTLLHADRPHTIVATAHFVRAVDRIQYGIEQGPCITAAATAATTRSGTLGADPRWPQFASRIGPLGVHSALSLPLIHHNEVIGALNVFSKSTHAFDDDAAHLAEGFAVPAAATAQNAHALADAIRLTRHLARAVDRRADIDHAIGIVISRTGASPADAFAHLRAICQRENRPLSDVATAMIDRAARRPHK